MLKATCHLKKDDKVKVLTGKDRGNDGGGSRDTGDADKHPKRLAQIDDVEEPAEKDPENGQRRDDNAKWAGQRIDDAL